MRVQQAGDFLRRVPAVATVDLPLHDQIEIAARRGERAPTPDGVTPCMIGVEGGVIFRELEKRFFDLRRLYGLACSDHLFEEIRLALPGRQCRDRVGELPGWSVNGSRRSHAFNCQPSSQNPSVLLGVLENFIDPGLHDAERDGFAGEDRFSTSFARAACGAIDKSVFIVSARSPCGRRSRLNGQLNRVLLLRLGCALGDKRRNRREYGFGFVAGQRGAAGPHARAFLPRGKSPRFP